MARERAKLYPTVSYITDCISFIESKDMGWFIGTSCKGAGSPAEDVHLMGSQVVIQVVDRLEYDGGVQTPVPRDLCGTTVCHRHAPIEPLASPSLDVPGPHLCQPLRQNRAVPSVNNRLLLRDGSNRWHRALLPLSQLEQLVLPPP